ncbi:hypothetical protein EMIHUDRAFT_249069 [Emiliania huxleyi CCMP1516]|uniref:Thioredoxin domain-containing protein n=2 Tax=Emiliania huxleyi TaxID=2903 RepID=A0A0D3IB45_EMIH1|nr:hypothetical protein EMIHUDRAFT_249069 [Emiliania huxleyi CCMP1516]EOD08480.1 hypothetical protein EMIHUDRAFT_249069 [Emiliania huxleyi CCMP1516]|eukprot:XP_005760909.1 hypothetical protein EMIHUDRAFT_249069 [Emiliania huxleyi CCMP1516]
MMMFCCLVYMHSLLLPRCAIPSARRAPPVRLKSSRFAEITSPAAYEGLVQTLPIEGATVVKFTAPWCRTCRQSNAKLSFIASKWRRASFYELKLSESQSVEWARQRGISQLPFIEVYEGRTCIERFVAPPSRVRALSSALTAARRRLRYQRRLRTALRLRALRRERQRLRSALLALESEERELGRRLRWDRVMRQRAARYGS